MKSFAIPLMLLSALSAPALAQALPECPPEPRSIKDHSFAHLERIKGEYESTMKSKGRVIESMMSELRAAGRWNKAAHAAWDAQVHSAPEFVRSVKAMEAAHAAEDPALVAFIKAMDGPRAAACVAMNRYVQTKLDFYAENYAQLDIAEKMLRSRVDAIRPGGEQE